MIQEDAIGLVGVFYMLKKSSLFIYSERLDIIGSLFKCGLGLLVERILSETNDAFTVTACFSVCVEWSR